MDKQYSKWFIQELDRKKLHRTRKVRKFGIQNSEKKSDSEFLLERGLLKKDNLIVDKSKVFALRVIELYKFLTSEKKEFVLSKQLLRSGTSIGANARESIRAQSTADFYAKLTISLKEAEETAYWLELLNESGYIDNDMFKSLYSDCDELIRILVKILKNTKK
jgi:four helix bundle protein